MKGETPGRNIEHLIMTTDFSFTFHLHVKIEIERLFHIDSNIHSSSITKIKVPDCILNRFGTVLGSISNCELYFKDCWNLCWIRYWIHFRIDAELDVGIDAE